jgi:hypothetical protein
MKLIKLVQANLHQVFMDPVVVETATINLMVVMEEELKVGEIGHVLRVINLFKIKKICFSTSKWNINGKE